MDLFAGIGGFSLAARWVGWETIGFCEIDKFCQKVLKRHWPGVPIYDDIRKLDGKEVGAVDIISGGYPCQPFSVAGKRGGEEDDRALWSEFARIISEAKPRYVVCENVVGHISMGLDEVLYDLEGLGYTRETFVIPACAVDAPHRRDRIWIVAHATSAQCSRRTRAGDNGAGWSAQRPMPTSQVVADTNSAPGKGNKRTERGGKARTNNSKHCRWEAEPAICRVVDGLPNRSHRLRGLGNAIVPQVAEIIFRAIQKAEDDSL